MSRKKLTIVIEFNSLLELFKIFRNINRSVRLGTERKTFKADTFNYWFTFEYIPEVEKKDLKLSDKFLTIKSRV